MRTIEQRRNERVEEVAALRKRRPSGENGYTDILWQIHKDTLDHQSNERDALREAISTICREPDSLAERELMIVSHQNLVEENEKLRSLIIETFEFYDAQPWEHAAGEAVLLDRLQAASTQ